jgi:hypothetical protein
MAPGTLIDKDKPTQIPRHPQRVDSLVKIPTVYRADLITKDFDALRFNAAASLQLHHGKSNLSQAPHDHLLLASPYNEPEHLLDLQTLDIQNRLLATALTALKPIRPDYATADYIESFNWDQVLNTLRQLSKEENHLWTEQGFYTVIFRSKLKEGADKQLLHDLDQHSHREATVSGGLLKYWFGAADGENLNLATCEFCSAVLMLRAEVVC